ncbi:MAG: hypothetical protein A2Y00_10400 [Omnitrophica WOR_2 bacterium GWF2_43_52]|nr:MAG: hypothetical protein A2Y00_10400 [Omnitrophica WOR_2 bacterium GWF2_43_52]OGX58825.1 MAG: hypothetical protein A2460_04465 [Omnitrophica WOR_2 bacterium RIFOXYC2_FULL_43_9]HAH20186.1 hypothetical protein [Candidatus Omnitrophota bacterium]HBG63034.1 hypothetical protein [Candidatus Omnitrophota bacterium]HCD37951.1 hypothetical protein [Candidatus Omnitrophota bacterium]
MGKKGFDMAKILIVEDEELACEAITAFLEKRGYETAVALTGKDGLAAYPRENPDLVLLDLGLPDMDGREILKEIKEKMPKIKVMVISAYKEEPIRDELAKLGADYFLGKPSPLPKLYEAVQEILKP